MEMYQESELSLHNEGQLVYHFMVCTEFANIMLYIFDYRKHY